MAVLKIIFLTVLTAVVQGAPSTSKECCTEKQVGGVEYRFVREEMTSGYQCLTDCIYERVDIPGPKYCFKAGDLEVVCEDKDRLSIMENYNYRQMTPRDYNIYAATVLKDIKQVYDRVGAVNKSNISFATVIKPLLDIDVESVPKTNRLYIAAYLAEDKTLRDVANNFLGQSQGFFIEQNSRKDIFENVLAFSLSDEAKNLEPEYAKYVEKVIREGKREGQELSGAALDDFKIVGRNISMLGVEFQRCLVEDTSYIWVPEGNLTGVAPIIISSMEKNASTGFLKVPTLQHYYDPVMTTCSNPTTRFAMKKAFDSRCMEKNTAGIEEMLQLRQKQADILGYSSYAVFMLEDKMAKNPDNVTNFLEELSQKIKPLWDKEREEMLDLKKSEAAELGFEYDDKINGEDYGYYSNMVQLTKFSVNHTELRNYFPLETVTKGLMKIHQTVFGLNFTKVKDANDLVWNDDVDLFQVDDIASGETLGYFFLDLFPREGKYRGSATLRMEPGSLDRDGNRRKTVVALINNFPTPTEESPSLLTHSDVRSFISLFGNVIHFIVSQTKTSIFHGLTNVERDFVAAPGQVMENWAWEGESLQLISSHYKDGSELPKDLLDKLVASKTANAGGQTLSQILYATLDQKLHAAKSSDEKVDTAAVAKDLSSQLLGMETPEGINFVASWPHLVNIGSLYYGFLWSEVFSTDMIATRFKVEGILNQQTGMDFREKILQPGSTIAASEMLRNFLGREPNQDAFLNSKGIEL